VLKGFHAKAAEATSFVQEPEVSVNRTRAWGVRTVVSGMIDVIQSDLARPEFETSSAEAEVQKQYG